MLSQADTTRIINKLRSEGLTSISECKPATRKIFSRNGWEESDIDVLLLDDVEWKDTHWIEPFIHCHLHSLHAVCHAQFLKIIKDCSIKSESEHSSILFPVAVTLRPPCQRVTATACRSEAGGAVPCIVGLLDG